MLLHTCYTWLVANLLHPLFIFCMMEMTNRSVIIFLDEDIFWLFINCLIFSIGYSLPYLLAGWVCLSLVSRVNFTINTRFWIWVVAATQLAVLELVLILALGKTMEPQILFFVLPGAAAACTAVLIRYRQFIKLLQLLPGAGHTPHTINGQKDFQ